MQNDFAAERVKRDPALCLLHPDGTWKTVVEMKGEAVQKALEAMDGDKLATAKCLGIELNTLNQCLL